MGNYISDILTIVSFVLFGLMKVLSKYEKSWTLLLLGVFRVGENSEKYSL